MSGLDTPGNNWSRRKFVSSTLQAGGALALLGANGCSWQSSKKIPCEFVGANSNFGHLLKTLQESKPAYQVNIPLLIIGGGISGLTAGYECSNNGMKDLLILDNGDETGGNAVSGKNEFSEFPWGAHYLTLPNADNIDLIKFLEKNHFIEGYNDEGKPFYREIDICQAPQERLFIKNKWQEGLIPHYGVADSDKKQIRDFLKLIDELKLKKNIEGKFSYNIPIANGSHDDVTLKLDQITFRDWLNQNNYKSEVLNWFLNYGTKDDYGTSVDDISALVGLHYFAARRGDSANGVSNTVLTWPEGNHKLVKILAQNLNEKIKNRTLVFHLENREDKMVAQCIEQDTNTIYEIIADKCILATPQYINKRLLKNEEEYLNRDFPQLEYSPWLIANITIKDIDDEPFIGLCWDNVIYGSDSLGYVYAQHQNLDQVRGPKVITWYYPITHRTGKEARDFLRSTNEEYWLKKIQADLEKAHRGISKKIMDIKLWEWGHAMVKPLPGIVSRMMDQNLSKPVRDQIFFCHSDLSGISLFEEAFYHGMRVSKEVLKSMNV
jgi:predicted NAD/FAD-dependent oxidoreductase